MTLLQQRSRRAAGSTFSFQQHSSAIQLPYSQRVIHPIIEESDLNLSPPAAVKTKSSLMSGKGIRATWQFFYRKLEKGLEEETGIQEVWMSGTQREFTVY